MANVLSPDKQIAVIGALAEGSSTSQACDRASCFAVVSPLTAVRAFIIQEFRNNAITQA